MRVGLFITSKTAAGRKNKMRETRYNKNEVIEIINILKRASRRTEDITMDYEALRMVIQYIKDLENQNNILANVVHELQCNIDQIILNKE